MIHWKGLLAFYVLGFELPNIQPSFNAKKRFSVCKVL